MIKVYIARLLLKLFFLIPINPKKVFFSSYEGGPISCNPKYIFKAIKSKYGNTLTYVWEWNKLSQKQLDSDRIIFVKHNSLSYIYHIMTAKVLISNTGISAVFPLRKTQLSINTWHGAGCYKKVGVDLAETNLKEYQKRCYYSEKNTTYYLSGCGEWTRVFSAAVLSNPQKFLPIGSPRNDMLINGISEHEKDSIKSRIGVSGKMVLYAPTYRGQRETPEEARCPLDVNQLLLSLQKRFGGQWIFAYRCHYATASQFKCLNNAIDLSWYDDMQELLAVTDVLITDYSSSIWDFSFTGKPCFLYCYDLNQYMDERDFYMPIKDWHFPVSENFDELIVQIETFDNNSFREGLKLHHIELMSYEHGDATHKVERLISKFLGD